MRVSREFQDGGVSDPLPLPAGWVFRDRSALWEALLFFGCSIPILARDRLALSADRIGVGMALASLTGLAFIYPAGLLVDRYGRKPVIVPATVVAGISMVLFLGAPSYAWFLMACVVWSVAIGTSGAAPAAYAADVAPPSMNAVGMSTYRMLSDLGYVVGPIALGVVADLLGARPSLMLAAVLLVATGLLFARWAPEPHRPRPPQIREGSAHRQ